MAAYNPFRSIKLILLVGIVVLLCNCTGLYLLKQGSYMFKYQLSAKPIDKILKKKEITDSLTQFLKKVESIRRFAIEDVGLEDNSNYTRYVNIEKDYLIDVVYAAKTDTFDQYLWRYPFMGKLPYKGFFEPKDAQAETLKLKNQGYDTYVGKVDGFSTLGVLSDPVYSFMRFYSTFSLASLIIHEQTHATVYIKGQSQFNEELAQFTGIEGAKNYLKKYHGEQSKEYNDALFWFTDFSTYNALNHQLYNSLDSLYTKKNDKQTIIQEKEKIIADFKLFIANKYDSLFQTDRFRGIPDRTINNANLMIQKTYTRDLKFFNDLYDFCDRDMKKFILIIREVKKIQGDPKEFLKNKYLR